MTAETLNPWHRVQSAYRHRAARIVFRRLIDIRPRRPLISFTFDDFPCSALRNGGAILNRFGAAGTFYASLGLMGQEGPTGVLFTESDLTVLIEQGHELGCHTFTHCDSWETDPQEFERSIIQNRVALNEILPGKEFKTFSYPISLPRPLTKAKVARHFSCSRAGGQTANVDQADVNQLSAFFLEKSTDDFAQVQNLINLNRERRGWLIFATHDISETPTRFGCTPEFLERVVRTAFESGAQVLPVMQALELLTGPAADIAMSRTSVFCPAVSSSESTAIKHESLRPMVSILIPAYNAEEWIADTLRSALAQTWEPKEIIVVDDGSRDRTLSIAREFESFGVRVVAQPNRGGSAARNTAFSLSRGEYIQWLDADDLLAPDKIAKQMEIALACGNKRIALSSPFGRFRYRWDKAQFEYTDLWADLLPAEWLYRKMAHNLYMQTATWLVSRELAEAAGPWDTRMHSDDDGEYFCRVLLKSEGVSFVPDTRVYYRAFRYGGLAYVGKSSRKIDALWVSMKLHIDYLLSLENTARTREASIAYMQRNLIHFFPNNMNLVQEAQLLAEKLGGRLGPPHLSWKYTWVRALFGWGLAKTVARSLRKARWATHKHWDRIVFRIANRKHNLDIPTSLPALASPGLNVKAQTTWKGQAF